MQNNKKNSFQKGLSSLEITVFSLVVTIIIVITLDFVKNQTKEIAIAKDVVRCIIDENASSLKSPACERVVSHCSNDKPDSCKKLLIYTDDGIHSNQALSILETICAKGGKSACDAIINRCIEDSANCEISGKTYDVKNYLAMKADKKNSTQSVMIKKLKTYYDKDVDNIVTSVIDTCLEDKNSMACKIFTSKIYQFTSSEKAFFVLNNDSNSEIEFLKTGLSLLIKPEIHSAKLSKNNKENTYNIISDKNTNETETLTDKENNEEELTSENDDLTDTNKEVSNNPELSEISKDIVDDEAFEPLVFKSSLTTSESNHIDYIKNKIYSFDITYKEPTNTKIRWLVSFDNKATWKKWDGKNWVQLDSLDIQNIDLSKIGNTSAEVEKGLKNYTLQEGELSLDFAVELLSTDKEITPAVSKVEIRHY